jgi:dinuclear metal center YbgI/SA1388 family protein
MACYKVKDILKELEEFAPPALKMDFDNVGLLVGYSEADVSSILISLDITREVIDEAIKSKAQLIVSHHPLFFSLKTAGDTDAAGKKVTALLSGHLSAICMHTNLDAAPGGVGDAFAEAAGLTQTANLADEVFVGGKPYSYGRLGFLKQPAKLADYLVFLKSRLNTGGLRYYDAGRDVHKVAAVNGSGGDYLKYALSNGCDTFITSDIKYDVFLDAKEAGINLIDGDHFCTENVVTPVLEKRLNTAFPEIVTAISKIHGQTARFL